MAAIPQAARETPGGPAASWWRYVERGRAHEVLAEWSEHDGRLHVTERDPSDDTRFSLDLAAPRPWEARVELWLLESRLAELGEYWRSRPDAPGWSRVARPAGAPRPDTRPNALLTSARAPFVHHYHGARGEGDHLLAALRGGTTGRLVVVRASLDAPQLDVGRIDLLQASLPEKLSRSLVLHEQLALASRGYEKLTTRDDYERAFGRVGEARAERLVDEVLDRVKAGELDRPDARPEDSDAYAEFLLRIHDPRLAALHARFLAPGEEDRLLAAGPVEIRKTVAGKRERASHVEKHLLSLLEASLLARERMRGGRLRRGDPEVRALTRLSYYL